MNPSFQRSLERYMRLEETPEEDLERMGEVLSLSMGVCDGFDSRPVFARATSFEHVRGRSSHRHDHVAVVIPW